MDDDHQPPIGYNINRVLRLCDKNKNIIKMAEVAYNFFYVFILKMPLIYKAFVFKKYRNIKIIYLNCFKKRI